MAARAEADHRDPLDPGCAQPADGGGHVVQRLLAGELVQLAEALLPAGIVAFQPAPGRGTPVVELRCDREVAGRGQSSATPRMSGFTPNSSCATITPAGRGAARRAGEVGPQLGAVGHRDLDRFVVIVIPAILPAASTSNQSRLLLVMA